MGSFNGKLFKMGRREIHIPPLMESLLLHFSYKSFPFPSITHHTFPSLSLHFLQPWPKIPMPEPSPPRTTTTLHRPLSSTPTSSLNGHFTEPSSPNSSPLSSSCTSLFSLSLATVASPTLNITAKSAVVSAFSASLGLLVE